MAHPGDLIVQRMWPRQLHPVFEDADRRVRSPLPTLSARTLEIGTCQDHMWPRSFTNGSSGGNRRKAGTK